MADSLAVRWIPDAECSIAGRKDRAGAQSFFCEIDIEGKTYPGIANVGIKPTVTEEKKLLIEAFLFGYSGNAYGEKIRINLKKFRERSKKFDEMDTLKRQIDKDIAKGMEYFGIV